MTPDTATVSPGAPSASAPVGRPVLLGLAALLLLFGATVAGFPVMWWSRYAYTQGFVVAAAVVFLFWRDRRPLREVARAAGAPSEFPYLVAGAFSLLWMVAWIMSVQMVAQLSLLAVLTVWALIVLGRASARYVLPAAGTFLLGIPIWDSLIPLLRRITVAMSSAMVSLLRVPAEIEGDVITIRYGAFVVENGCAGQAYLLAGLTVGALYSHLFMRGWKTRVGVIALAGGIALLSNWVRIAHLVWIGDASQMQAEMIYDHGNHGWLVFSLSLIPFFLLARWMERWNDAPGGGGVDARPGETWTPVETGTGSPTGAEPGAAPRPLASGPRRRVVPATLAAAVGPLLYLAVSALPAASVPEIGPTPAAQGWQTAAATDVTDWDIGFPGVDREARTVFVRAGDTVQAEELSYRRQRQGAELIGSENRIAPDSLVLRQRTVGPLPPRGQSLQEAWVGTPDGLDLVWYRYRVAGVETASATEARLLQLLGFVTRRVDAQLVALSSPCDGESCEGAARALFSFVTGAEPPEAASDTVSEPAENESDNAAEDGGHDGSS